MTDRIRRNVLKQAALGTAFLAYPHGSVLGANDRVRVGDWRGKPRPGFARGGADGSQHPTSGHGGRLQPAPRCSQEKDLRHSHIR
jgi:hypothetical protein